MKLVLANEESLIRANSVFSVLDSSSWRVKHDAIAPMKTASPVIIVLLLLLTLSFRAQAQPYGIDRRELNEAYLNRRLPATESGPFPLLLSQTGAFENVTNLTPMRAMIPYEVNTPLWSDAAKKTRWLFVPKDGKIGFTTTNWSFPPGTVFVKHFDLVTNEFNGNKRRLETRFLVIDSTTNTYAVTYRWRENNSDADLLTAAGSNEPVVITLSDNSTTRTQTWGYPSRDQCHECHTKEAGGSLNKGVLGVKTAQQNGNFAYPQPGGGTVTDNQLRTLNHLNLFQPALNEPDIPTMPKMAAITDNSATMEHRVRSYLDVNCSHCHQPDGQGVFDGRFSTPYPGQDVANGTRPVLRYKDIKGSLILRHDGRLESDNKPNPMPPLGKSINDEEWLTLLRNYITNSFNPTNATSSSLTSVTVAFSALPTGSATTLANYQLERVDPPATNTLSNPVLDNGTRSVTFTVAPAMVAGQAYRLTVKNVLDQSTPANRVWPDIGVTFDATGSPVGALNDNFSGATMLAGADASGTGNNFNATKEAGEPDHADNAGGASLWWSWIAPSNGPVRIGTSGSDFDTLLAVYTGSSVSTLTPIASNDDSEWLSSEVTFSAVSNQTYYIAVDGFGGEQGSIELSLHEGPAPQGPANDNFVNATLLPGGSGSVSGTNQLATKETDEPNHGHNAGGASVWWYWTAPSDGDLSVDTAGSSFDTTLAIYTGSSVDNLIEVAENDDDGALLTSSVQLTVASGVTYQIAVDGYYGRVGDITLNYSFTAARAALAPVILRSQLDNGQFLLEVDGPGGAEVEIQSSDDLNDWKPVTTIVIGKHPAVIIEPAVSSQGGRFYRAVRH